MDKGNGVKKRAVQAAHTHTKLDWRVNAQYTGGDGFGSELSARTTLT